MAAEFRRDGVRSSLLWDVLREVASARAAETGRTVLDIVDVGGGTGGLAVPFASLGHNVTVVDPSPDALAAAQRRAAEAGARLAAVQGEAASLDSVAGAAAADLIICHNVLEYVDSPADAMAAIARVLRSPGTVSVLASNVIAAVLHHALAGRFAEARLLLLSSGGTVFAPGGTVFAPGGTTPPGTPPAQGDPSPRTPLGGDPSPRTPLGGDPSPRTPLGGEPSSQAHLAAPPYAADPQNPLGPPDPLGPPGPLGPPNPLGLPERLGLPDRHGPADRHGPSGSRPFPPGRRFTLADLTALIEGAGLQAGQAHGVRIFSGLVPAGLVDGDPGSAEALRALEAAAAGTPPLRDIAAQLHILGHR